MAPHLPGWLRDVGRIPLAVVASASVFAMVHANTFRPDSLAARARRSRGTQPRLDAIERDELGPVAGAAHHVADQLDRAEFRIDHVHARRMAQKIENSPVVDAPLQR